MTLQELLNADIGIAGAWLRQGFDWWIRELADLIPARFRRERQRAGAIAELGDAEVIRIWRKDRFVERRAGDTTPKLSADLALPPSLVLERQVMLPALAPNDLKRLVGHEIDRLTPFTAEQVYLDVEVLSRDVADSRLTARLGVIRRESADAALERAADFGLAPRRIGVRDETLGLHLDFLPAMRAAGRGGRPDRGALIWWSAFAACLIVNVAILVFKDISDVAALRHVVDLQQPTVALTFKLRQRVEGEAAVRRVLLAQRSHNEPLRVLDAATRALPPPQALQRLEWDGQAVRLVGYRDPAFDVIAAIGKSDVLTRPRAAIASESVQPAAGAKAVFDIVADIREPRR